MPQEPKPFYRVLVGTFDYGQDCAYWDCWSAHDTQKQAYDIMAEYREEWGPKDFTPCRIVRVTGLPKSNWGEGDETFIDETGTSIIEWERMIRANEIQTNDDDLNEEQEELS